jgi:hypothetical protein
MALAQRLSEIDRDLDALGAVPADLVERVLRSVAGSTLDAVDRDLDALANGVVLVAAAPLEVVQSSANVAALKAAPASAVVSPVAKAAASPLADLAAAAFAEAAPVSSLSLPAEPSPAVPTAVDLAAPERALIMSEPPMSQPPPASTGPFVSDELDPFEGRPAPMPVPQRAASVWPAASVPAPKRVPAPPLRTSGAPPPPLPSVASGRPRSMRPSDTPDPFPAVGRATSRPPPGLSADDLFGGMTAPPPADSPVRFDPSMPPKAAARPTMVGASTDAPPAPDPDAGGDDFEMLVDDEMLEIDVEEMDALD